MKPIRIGRLVILAVVLICTILVAHNVEAIPQLHVERTVLRLAEFPQGIAGMMAEYIPETGDVLLFGGYHREGETRVLSDEVWRYDPTLDELTLIGHLPAGLALAAHVYVPEEKLVYFFGGLVKSGNTLVPSAAVHTYHVLSGETDTLPAILPSPRTRASAILTSTGIFIFGGADGADAFTNPINEAVHYSLNLDTVTGAIPLPDDYGSIDPNYWVAAFNLSEILPPQLTPLPGNFPGPEVQSHVLVLGTHGYVRFNPAQGEIVEAEASFNLRGNVGAAAAYLPLRRQVWSASGYGLTSEFGGFHCSDSGHFTIDPHRETRSQLFVEGIPAMGDGEDLVPNTLNDSAAVYVPDLDRMLVFGGFQVRTVFTGQLCGLPWSDNPLAGQYTNQIYSISPQYGDEYDWTLPEGSSLESNNEIYIEEVINPVAGRPTTFSLYRENAEEAISIALQAPYRSEYGGEYLATRILESEIDESNPLLPTISVTLPDDIYPSPGRGQRIVGICVVSEDRFLPPNCREMTLTLEPGGLAGVVRRDLSGIGQNHVEPAPGATVELRDMDNDLVASTTVGADGTYNFCPPGEHCLALGSYSLVVYRDYVDGDTYVHLPQSVAVEIRPGETADGDVTLETTEIMGPTVQRLDAEFDGAAGDDVGTFMAFEQNLAGLEPPEVWNTFVVTPQDFIRQRPTARVRFEFLGTPFGNVDNDGSDGWTATFDMTEVLQAGSNTLRITAFDNKGLAGEARDFNVLAIRAKSAAAQGWMAGERGLVWNPSSASYILHLVTNPARPTLGWPANPPQALDLDLVTFYNSFRADLELFEVYYIDNYWAAVGDGEMVAQIMSLSPSGETFRYPLDLLPQYSEQRENGQLISRTIDEYRLRAELDLCQTRLLPGCDQWIPTPLGIGYDKPLKKDKDGETTVQASFRIGIDMKYAAELYVSGYYNADDWGLERVRVTPRPIVSARGAITFSIDALFASVEVGAGLVGDVGYSQPIIFEPDQVYLENPCVQFIVSLKLWVTFEALFGLVDETAEWSEELLNERLPAGCDITLARSLLQLYDFEVPDYQPAPVAAINPSDGRMLQLWVEDVQADPDQVDLSLRYVYLDNDGTVEQSGAITGADAMGGAIFDPAVAFWPDGRAIAVWSQISEADANGAEFIEALRAQELYAAFWEPGSGWGNPERLTNDNFSDGRPTLATTTRSDGMREAAIIWVRDGDGDAVTRGDWQLVSRLWNSATNWEAAAVVADDPGSADWEPAAAYNGDTLWLVWVRDADANMLTESDRRLTYAIREAATGWSAAQQPAAWPARALHPSLTFSPQSDYPLLAFVVSPDGSGGTAAASVTLENRLYAAWRGATAAGWDVQPVGDARGAWPQATTYTDNHALIILRGFGGGEADGTPSNSGQIAVAEGELRPDGARWAPPGVITDEDGGALWQISAVTLPIPDTPGHPLPNGHVQFVAVTDSLSPTAGRAQQNAAQRWQLGRAAPVRVLDGRQAQMLGGDNNTGVFDIAEAMDGIDPIVEDVQVSNPAPRPGELVNVTVTLRNRELRPMGTTDSDRLTVNLTCQEYAVAQCDFPFLDEAQYEGEMLFNEAITFHLAYRASGGVDRLRVVVEDHPMDLDTSNNDNLFTVGDEAIPAPAGLNAAFVTEKEVLAQWQAPPDEDGGYVNDTGTPLIYRVYRSTGENGPWAWIAETHATQYFDLLTNGRQYYYAVRAYDARGRHSPLSLSVQANELDTGGGSGIGDVLLPMVVRP